MNPLSSHPPARTPRTSVASSHFTSVSASMYDTMDDVGERQVEAEVERDQDVDEDDEEEVPEEDAITPRTSNPIPPPLPGSEARPFLFVPAVDAFITTMSEEIARKNGEGKLSA